MCVGKIICGHSLTKDDIDVAKYLASRFNHLTYTQLVKTLCDCQEWETRRGIQKVELGSRVLDYLESEGILKCPQKKGTHNMTRKRKPIVFTDRTNPKEEMNGNVKDYNTISLQFVQTKDEKEILKEYLERYHPEKYAVPYGSNIIYSIKNGNDLLGCMVFSASAWALKDRDTWIGWNVEDRRNRLIYVVNNTRFLLLPWVKIENLASYILGIASRRIQTDWLEEYLYAPVLLETFIDTAQYKGTCYRAANWIHIGTSTGKGRNSKNGVMLSTPRDIYVYPLEKNFRDILTGKRDPIVKEVE